MYPDIFVNIAVKLEVPEVINVALTCKECTEQIKWNAALWLYLCIREFNVTPPTGDQQAVHTNIGLAQQSVTWRDYFILMYCSDVFTCK